jgi:hypothetical protein
MCAFRKCFPAVCGLSAPGIVLPGLRRIFLSAGVESDTSLLLLFFKNGFMKLLRSYILLSTEAVPDKDTNKVFSFPCSFF